MSRPRLVVLAALALLAPAACSDDGPGLGEARLQLDGEAVLERADGGREVVTDAHDLAEGDRVSMVAGQGELLLADGSRLELRAGLGDAAPTAVVVGEVPVLEAGELLVTTPDAVTVDADGTEVTVAGGAARVQRDFGMAVAAYDSEVALDSAGVVRSVPALRQMTVPDLGRPPQAARPLAIDEADPWDRRYLGAALDLDEDLETLALALTDNLAEGEGRTVGFFRIVLPGLEDEPAFDDALLDAALPTVRNRDRPPDELLLGSAIANLGEQDDFLTRWEEVFEFRDAGAAWGLVALDQAVRGGPLVGVVEQALSTALADASFALPPVTDPSASADPVATPTTAPPPPTAPVTTAPPPPPTTAPPSPPTTTPPEAPLAPPLLDPVVEPVTDLLGDLVDGLVGGLLGG